jgi:hypothetical protein
LIFGAIKAIPVHVRTIVVVVLTISDIGMPTRVLADAFGRIDLAMGATIALVSVLAQTVHPLSVPSGASIAFSEYKSA